MIADYFRFGWRRRALVMLCGRLPKGRLHDWLLDFLYPDDFGITFR